MRTLGYPTISASRMPSGWVIHRPHGRGWWSATTDDMVAAGDAAKGYIGGHLADGANFPVTQRSSSAITAAAQEGQHGGLRWWATGNQGRHGHHENRSDPVAMDKYCKPVSGEQVRWALEHLKLDDKRLKQLGASGLMQPLATSCADHEGGGSVRFNQWDGAGGGGRLGEIRPGGAALPGRNGGQVAKEKTSPAGLFQGE